MLSHGSPQGSRAPLTPQLGLLHLQTCARGTGCFRVVGQDLIGAVRSRLLMSEYVDVWDINNRTAAL